MESTFQVFVTPREMKEILNDVEVYNVRYCSFLGMETEGDFDAETCSDSEWEALQETPCLYQIRLRHDEWLSRLSGTYKSWKHVAKVMHRRDKALADYIYSQYKQTSELLWRWDNANGYKDYYYLVKIMQTSNDKWYACKGAVNLSESDGLSYAEIIDAVEPFGYKSIKEVKEKYGEDTYGFIAECAFENMPEDGMWRLSDFFDTREEILAYVIKNMLRKRY